MAPCPRNSYSTSARSGSVKRDAPYNQAQLQASSMPCPAILSTAVHLPPARAHLRMDPQDATRRAQHVHARNGELPL